jgi:2-polyprenyl-3-methyl-5-hydroxy-6-metoxy-1,4-benzoquinol methylase
MDEKLKLYEEKNPNQLSPQQFDLIRRDLESTKATKSDEYFDFILWCENMPSRQAGFLNYLKKISFLQKDDHILEVGCGTQARLSALLNEEGYDVTSIDPKLNLEICKWKGIKDAFDYHTFDLNPFDCVIAQEPCDATEHIVRACMEKKIPFVIALCATPHEHIDGYMDDEAFDWYTYLYHLTQNQSSLQYVSLSEYSMNAILILTRENIRLLK